MKEGMKFAIGSDHRGAELKDKIMRYLHAKKIPCFDAAPLVNQTVDYPDVADKVISYVGDNEFHGILICGSGLGMCMAANKKSDVRAAVCYEVLTAERAREHNDANVLVFGADFVDSHMIPVCRIINTWIETPFSTKERHVRRVNKMEAIHDLKK